MSVPVDSEVRPWMRWTLIAAGGYNLAWGAAVVLFPASLFRIAGMEPPLHTWLWQCIGMIVGVYGVGYLAAARSPLRHWPITLVGLLGKIFGPVGFVGHALAGNLPWSFGWTLVTNDLIWWLPFAAILLTAARAHQDPGGDRRMTLEEAFGARSVAGTSLRELSGRRPHLLVFLRHAGCTFCKEALADLSAQRPAIRAAGAGIAVVHMGSPEQGRAMLASHGLDDIEQFSDPEQALYRAFDLGRGGIGQLLGPVVWWRGLQATLRGHRAGRLVGDGFQMPGAFLVDDGRIVRAYRHRTSGDRPDYAGLAASAASCPVPGAS